MRKILIAVAGLALAAAPLSAAHAVSSYTAEASVPQQADLGKTIKITGHVSDGPVDGLTVDIHANYSSLDSGGPIHIGHAAVNSSGNFSKSYTPPKGGTYAITVTVEDKYGNPVAAASAGPLHVMRWTALQNLHLSATDPAGKTTGKKVDGKKWTHELYVGDNGQLHFSYDGVLCTRIQSYVGVSDTAPSGSKAHYAMYQTSYTFQLSSATRGVKAKHFTRDLDPSQSVIDIGVEFESAGPVTLKLILGEPKAFCSIG